MYAIRSYYGASPELYTRWMTIGAFSPMFRAHTAHGNRRSEPWNFGEHSEDIVRRYIQFRYKLMPYIYSAFYRASQTGLPVNRSLVLDYSYEQLIFDHKYDNEYMFGDAILVAPVKGDENVAKVFLPKGDWYSIFDDENRITSYNVCYTKLLRWSVFRFAIVGLGRHWCHG